MPYGWEVYMGNIVYFIHCSRTKGDRFMAEITKERMLQIEEIVKSILADINSEKPYVDIVSIVKREGFEVEPMEMDSETTGCLLVNNDERAAKRLIMVNTDFKNPENESDVVFKKSRFITAHEYGHYKLHREDGEPIYAHRDTYHRTDPTELEADYFARSILMPLSQFQLFHGIVKKMSNGDEQFTVEMLSKLFRVTQNKVKKRIGDLSVLG